MKCLHVGCLLDATDHGACPAHRYWSSVILADPRYMTEQPPPSPKPSARRKRAGAAPMSRGLPSWWGAALPCGCVRGVKLCAEGEALWDAVADAHKPLATLRDYYSREYRSLISDYNARLENFNAHVEFVAEAATQESLL